MSDDPREILEPTWERISLGVDLTSARDQKDCAHRLSQALIDLIPSISASEARLIAEALEAAYQLGRLSP